MFFLVALFPRRIPPFPNKLNQVGLPCGTTVLFDAVASTPEMFKMQGMVLTPRNRESACK